MSRGSSTTQIEAVSRRESVQISHSSVSLTFQQRRQKVMRSFTSVMAWARRRASTGSSLRRWKAMRCADLGPTPGRRPSSSIRSWTGAAYTSRTEHPAEAAEVEAAHGAGLGLLGLGHGVVEGGEHEVLEHPHVLGVDGGGIDRDGAELEAAGDGDLHHAA